MGRTGPIATGAKRTSGKAAKAAASPFLPTRGMSKESAALWHDVVKSLPAGHFSEADRPQLRAYCEAAVKHAIATDHLADGSYVYTDNMGVMRRNPYSDIQDKAAVLLASLATKLRITKSSMISPKVAGRAAQDAAEAAAVEDEFGDLLFNGNEQVRQ